MENAAYSLLFPLLFDHVGEDLCTRLSLSVQQVGRDGSFRGLVVVLLLGLPLFVHFDAEKQKKSGNGLLNMKRNPKNALRSAYSRLLHLDLLRVPLFVVQLGLQTDHLPGFVRALVGLSALLLPFPFMVVQAVAVPLAVQLDVLVLRLKDEIPTHTIMSKRNFAVRMALK